MFACAAAEPENPSSAGFMAGEAGLQTSVWWHELPSPHDHHSVNFTQLVLGSIKEIQRGKDSIGMYSFSSAQIIYTQMFHEFCRDSANLG